MDTQIVSKVQQFFSQFKHQSFTKGEILIRADDNPLGIYFLIKGEVKKYTISIKGEESIITIFKQSSFFPMSWAINNTPNKYYYEALRDVEVWRASSDQVIAFIKQNPDVLYDLLSRVYSGLEGLTERMIYIMGGSAHDRLIVELIINIKRFGKEVSEDKNTYWKVAVSETDLAAQTGLTRETISRELKVLKDKKLVFFEKSQLIISDLEALKNELSEIN